MLYVCPSILAADFSHLGRDCARALDAGADMLHFDVMDGHFVPNLSFGTPVLRSLHRALPNAFYDVHFMLEDPAQFVEPFAQAGADRITFHYEAAPRPEPLIQKIRGAGCKAGICIKPQTPVACLLPFLHQVDLVLVMSVEPGFGGQSFDPAALGRIAELRAACTRQGLTTLIEVDGGVNAKTAPACVAAGADVLVAGSAIFGAPDMAEAIRLLKKCGESGA